MNAPSPEPRTLPQVLSEIEAARKAWLRQRRTDREAEALDRYDALEAEARAMIEQATGVSWDAIMETVL